MLGRTLVSLFVLSLISEVGFSNVIIQSAKNESYSWKEMQCRKHGADLTIDSKGLEKSGQKGAIHFTIRNYETADINTPSDKDIKIEMKDKTVGAVIFTEHDGKVWGDVHRSEINTKCNLYVRRTEKNQISIHGGCVELGDAVRKTGPRTPIKIDEIEPLSCTVI